MSESKIIDLQDVRRKKKNTMKKSKKKAIITVAFVIFVVVVIYPIGKLLYERSQLNRENEKLKEERDSLKKTVEHSDTSEYIENKAREELNLVLPGELIYVVPNMTNKQE